MHFAFEGGATILTSGTIVALPEGAGNAIEGGVTHEMRKGDEMLVPPNTPHW